MSTGPRRETGGPTQAAPRSTATLAHARSSAGQSTQAWAQAQTLVDVTPLADQDRAFVLRTWRTEGVVDNIDHASRLRVMGEVSEACIDSLTLLVARPVGDALTILGWMAHDGERVHAVFVRAAVRRIGVARALFAASGCRRVVAYPLSVRGVQHHTWRHEPWHGWMAAIEGAKHAQ